MADSDESDEDTQPSKLRKLEKADGSATSKLVMDGKMKETRKTDKKERKWAQTSLKKACRIKDVKFFNKLISEFGTAKQLGFSFQVP